MGHRVIRLAPLLNRQARDRHLLGLIDVLHERALRLFQAGDPFGAEVYRTTTELRRLLRVWAETARSMTARVQPRANPKRHSNASTAAQSVSLVMEP